MSPMVNGALGPMEVDRVGTTTPTSPKSIGEWRAMVARAFGRSGLSQKAGAIDLGITPQALSKQLAGLEHLSFWRMYALPPEFWRELVLLIVDFHALTLGGTEQDRRDVELGRTIRDAITRSLSR